MRSDEPGQATVTHLSYTGYYAGYLLCGKQREAGDRAYHASYVNLDAPYAQAINWCSECVAAWTADEDEED